MKKGGVLARMGKMAERNKKTLNSKNMEIKKKMSAGLVIMI